jgi:hypothetical protein
MNESVCLKKCDDMTLSGKQSKQLERLEGLVICAMEQCLPLIRDAPQAVVRINGDTLSQVDTPGGVTRR